MKKSYAVHGNTLWCNQTIWVKEDKDGWWTAEIRDGNNNFTYARCGPVQTQAEAEKLLCKFLSGIVDTAVNSVEWK